MPPKWSRLNKVAVLFEYEVDAQRTTRAPNTGNESSHVTLGEKMFAFYYEHSSNSR